MDFIFILLLALVIVSIIIKLKIFKLRKLRFTGNQSLIKKNIINNLLVKYYIN